MRSLKVLRVQTARTLSYIGRRRRNTAGQHRVRGPPDGAPCAAPWPAAYACVSNDRTRQGCDRAIHEAGHEVSRCRVCDR
jgi:hypothetical protein